MKDNYDVIIIGSGMGVLTSSAWLTHMGMKVLVVAENPYHKSVFKRALNRACCGCGLSSYFWLENGQYDFKRGRCQRTSVGCGDH
jgi:hypothetical protein